MHNLIEDILDYLCITIIVLFVFLLIRYVNNECVEYKKIIDIWWCNKYSCWITFEDGSFWKIWTPSIWEYVCTKQKY